MTIIPFLTLSELKCHNFKWFCSNGETLVTAVWDINYYLKTWVLFQSIIKLNNNMYTEYVGINIFTTVLKQIGLGFACVKCHLFLICDDQNSIYLFFLNSCLFNTCTLMSMQVKNATASTWKKSTRMPLGGKCQMIGKMSKFHQLLLLHCWSAAFLGKRCCQP